ncbi:hypothetical protein [Brevundimonas olei]|uniref:hypothetical protein n=1 Tax=Brevundimonas olei TaxID=657642 RepID=UPI0031D3EBF1
MKKFTKALIDFCLTRLAWHQLKAIYVAVNDVDDDHHVKLVSTIEEAVIEKTVGNTVFELTKKTLKCHMRENKIKTLDKGIETATFYVIRKNGLNKNLAELEERMKLYPTNLNKVFHLITLNEISIIDYQNAYLAKHFDTFKI